MGVFSGVANVYAVPESKRGRFHAHEWDLRHPLFTCMVWVDPNDGSSESLKVRLETMRGDLIAIAPYNGEKGIGSCVDSAQYYVLTITNGLVDVELGIGFPDPSDSIEFSLSIQHFMRRRMVAMDLGGIGWTDNLTSKLDVPPSDEVSSSPDDTYKAAPAKGRLPLSPPHFTPPLAPSVSTESPASAKSDSASPTSGTATIDTPLSSTEASEDEEFGEFQ